MRAIPNRWVHKTREKRKEETAPAFENADDDKYTVESTKKQSKRFTQASTHAQMFKTLRGLRK